MDGSFNIVKSHHCLEVQHYKFAFLYNKYCIYIDLQSSPSCWLSSKSELPYIPKEDTHEVPKNTRFWRYYRWRYTPQVWGWTGK